MLSRTSRLFLIILIEGYVVLATELLAIRESVPFVGSGTETIAIIISAVLLPLAIGYHVGGRQRRLIRKRLLRNATSALVLLTFGLSYVFLEFFFTILYHIGIHNQILQAAIYALLFLSPAVFWLGQTVPLISNYFGRARLSAVTGRMLFFSTVGSFLGSVFSTLVLMNTIGVHGTVMVTGLLLAVLIPLLSRRVNYDCFIALFMLALLGGLNSPAALRQFHVVANNRYNTVAVHQHLTTGDRVFSVNRSYSSRIDRANQPVFSYIKYMDRNFIDPIAKPGMAPHAILVLGAGGFTVGLNDTVNDYTFVDIDTELKQVAEQHFLRKPLGPNKHFVGRSARAFVHRPPATYDLIIVDTYTHIMSAPMETTTEEFLRDVKKCLKPGGMLIVNQVGSPDFRDRFSVRYDHVFTNVFGVHTRQVVDDYNPWVGPKTKDILNTLYIYFDRPYNNDTTSYTDDHNSYSLDRY